MAFFLNINRMKKNIPTLNILIGMPGVGKTTYAKTYFNHKNIVYLSSDDIREEYNHEIENQKVFQIMHKQCKVALKEGKDVVFDATNISKKRRRELIKMMSTIGHINIDAYMFCMPIEMILENNLTRTERFIPFDTIVNYLRTLDVPMYYEGFNNIYLINNGLENDKYNIFDFLKKVESYNQGNPHHNETLGEHTKTVVREVEKMDECLIGIDYWIIRQAAMYHDYGKLYTRVYNKEKDKFNYYNHEKVSAYIWYCHEVQHNLIDDKRRYRLKDSGYQVAALIAHHMDFYKEDLNKTEKLLDDDDLYKMLIMLHRADEVRK